jgi:hypothetical protein
VIRIWTKNLKFVCGILFLSLGVSGFVRAENASCLKKIIAQAPTENPVEAALKRAPKVDSLGELQLKGKNRLVRIPILNQGPEDLCWSESETELAISEFKKANPKSSVKLSPEYSGFWHVYFQMKNHLEYFNKIAKKVAKLPPSERAQAIQELSQESLRLMKQPSRYVEKTLSWAPSQGSDEAIAMGEADAVGMMPHEAFNGVRKTMSAENSFENAIQRFVSENFFDPAKLKSYESVAADGINDPLYKQLSAKLKPQLGAKPPRPHDPFLYNNKTYTPLTFMKEHLKFNPNDFKVFSATPATHKLMLEAISDSLARGYRVPIGMPIFADVVPGTEVNFQMLAEHTGIFSPELCPGGKCAEIGGGHEIVITNEIKKNGKTTALVDENSWNLVGRAADGRMTKFRNKRGYDLITEDYLVQGMKAGFPYDITIPKEVAELKKYASLLKERR